MQRSFALALTALLLVFTLTACGNRANGSTQTPSSTQSETSGTTQPNTGSTANGSGGSQPGQNTTVGGEIGNAAGDVVDGVEDAVDDILPDGNANTRQRGTGGVPYGDMMNSDRR